MLDLEHDRDTYRIFMEIGADWYDAMQVSIPGIPVASPKSTTSLHGCSVGLEHGAYKSNEIGYHADRTLQAQSSLLFGIVLTT